MDLHSLRIRITGILQKTKGSTEPVKFADFVVLSENPLKIGPTKIKDIQVVETIKEGIKKRSEIFIFSTNGAI